jgi:hypothetical protein
MKLGRRNPLGNACREQEKKKAMRKRDSKYKKEEIKNLKIKRKKSIHLKNQEPPTRQDRQAHGEIPQPEESAQSVVTSAQDPLYAKRKMLLLSIEEASVLV